MKQISRDKVGLTKAEWTFLILIVLLALLFLWVAIKFIAWTIDRSEQISMTLGVFALAVSAYAALTSKRIKEFEITKGYLTARTLVEVDTINAVSESWQLYLKLGDCYKKSATDWNEAVAKTASLAKQYAKRQEQMPLLLSSLPHSKILNTQRLYVRIEEHLEEAIKLSVDINLNQKDQEKCYENRMATVHQEYLPNMMEIIDHYNELEYTSFSDMKKNFDKFKSAIRSYDEKDEWYYDTDKYHKP